MTPSTPEKLSPVLLSCYRALQRAREALAETRRESGSGLEPPLSARWGPRAAYLERALVAVNEAITLAEPHINRLDREARGGRPLGPVPRWREG